MLAVGPNGVGKTNLLEALHVGTQGFSPRTRNDAQLIRFGETATRVAVRGHRGTVPLEVELVVEAGAGKRAKANGAPLRATDQLRSETATLVFTPDRLGVVKGAPAARRAYFDRSIGRLSPARAQLAPTTASPCRSATRRCAVSRAGIRRATHSHRGRRRWRSSGRSWSPRGGRRCSCSARTSPSARRSSGLPEAELRYDGAPPSVAALEERLDRDIERGVTGLGPHLDDVVISSGPRELRSYGSQGEQRLAVLALLLAESELIVERGGVAPLLLLDDVLSELDPDRRRILAARVAHIGQALITATDAAMLPAEPDQLLEVSAGAVREAA